MDPPIVDTSMETLADFLGLTPREPDRPAPPEKLTAKQFCEAVLNSREFRAYIQNGIALGDLPAAIVCRIMDQGWGKPVDRVEFEDKTNHLADLTAEQCEQRALLLAERARQLRRQERPKEITLDSVH
jgi:hypothetical protein